MINDLSQLKTQKLEEYLSGDVIDENFLIEVLARGLSRPELLDIRDINRKKRDSFLQKLCDLTSDKYVNAHKFIISKYQIVKASEEIFDRLSKFLDKCDISKNKSDVQIWSHIKRFELEFNKIHSDLDRHLAKKPKRKFQVISPYVSIKDQNGHDFSADGASEHLVKYLTITLKLLAHKFGWFSNDKIVIPDEVNISEENTFQAGSIELLARSWIELEDISQRSIVFGGFVFKNNEENIQKDAKLNGVKTAYHFDREESEYEFHDAVACERVRRKSFQNFLEIISNEKVRDAVAQDIDSVGRLEDGSFLYEDEILACSILGDVFCVDILEDKKCYHGLTLAEWIRSYFTIQYISKRIENGVFDYLIKEDEIVNIFEKSGLGKDKCLKFVDLISFSKNSADIYDCPLIRTQDGRLYVSYYSCINFNVCNVILSRLSSLDTNSSDKGYRFEFETKSLVSNKVEQSKSFKFKRGTDEYEYDCVFILDSRLFILECKNRSLSWYNPVKAYRNKNYLIETARQVNRLKDALILYPEVIQENFGVDCSDYEIIPVVFNCMPFSWTGKIDGVYVSDFSALSRLFRSSSINYVSTNLKGQDAKETSYKQWKGEKLNSDDIIRHLERPIQVLPYAGSRKAEHRWWVADNQVAFTVKRFEIDPEEYHKQEKKIFGAPFEKFASKVKSKLQRKLMIKRSKKKNRRK